MTVDEVMEELRLAGRDITKRTFMRHGAKEPLFGVNVSELKKIVKKVKVNHKLAKDLYSTGNYDAMYLAGLIADDRAMMKEDLQTWVKAANCSGLTESTVAWVAAEGHFGWELALEWIESESENIACSGWATLSCVMSLRPDTELDLPTISRLIERIEAAIHTERNRVRAKMNSFLTHVACYVLPLSERALAASERIGKIEVDMGDTACEIRYLLHYVEKMRERGTLGKKKKTVKC